MNQYRSRGRYNHATNSLGWVSYRDCRRPELQLVKRVCTIEMFLRSLFEFSVGSENRSPVAIGLTLTVRSCGSLFPMVQVNILIAVNCPILH